MMSKNMYYRYFVCFLLFINVQLLNLFNPSVALSSNLVWHQSNITNSVSQDIRISPSDANVVYATVRNNGSRLYRSTDGAATFNELFLFNSPEDINSIAISHVDPYKFCISTYISGVHCSDNGGINLNNLGWINSSLTSKKTRFVSVDPKNDNIIYAGTGENNLNGGIYKSTNFGQTWSRIGISTFGNKNCLNIVIDTNDSNRIIAGSDSALFQSHNGGTTWSSLPLSNTNSPATVIDQVTPTTIFSGSGFNGIFKSVNNGSSWVESNTGIENAFIFRLAQNQDGILYASRRNLNGGIWTSSNYGNSWINISHPSWGNRNVWGLDVNVNKIVLNVEGLGIYYADIPETNKPNPVVFIPGFGGSWSYKGLVKHQNTTDEDWTLTPKFGETQYGPLLEALRDSGLEDNKNLFVFAYDFRKPISDTANTFYNFLVNKVEPSNPNKKINVITHSLGGMIPRQCFEKIASCSGKLNQVINGGAPHQGTLEAYKLWEGGRIEETDPYLKFAEKTVLHMTNLPTLSKTQIFRQNFLSLQNILPTFDYLNGKPYSQMSNIGKNMFLESLQPVSNNYLGRLHTLVGSTINTDYKYDIVAPSFAEQLLGIWPDGKPVMTYYAMGDGTILEQSAQVSGAHIQNYTIQHRDYFSTPTIILDTLNILGLDSAISPPVSVPTTKVLAFVMHSPAKLNVKNSLGQTVGTYADNDHTVFFVNPEQQYSLTLTGIDSGDFQLDAILANANASEPQVSTLIGSIFPQQAINLTFNTNNDLFPSFDSLNQQINSQSFDKYIDQINQRRTDRIALKIGRLLDRFPTTNNKLVIIRSLENNLQKLYGYLSNETDPTTRQYMIYAGNNLTDVLNNIHAGFSDPTHDSLVNTYGKLQQDINARSNQLNLSEASAYNLLLAQDYLDQANLQMLSFPYRSWLALLAAEKLL